MAKGGSGKGFTRPIYTVKGLAVSKRLCEGREPSSFDPVTLRGLAECEDDRVRAHPDLAVFGIRDIDLQSFALGEEDLANEVAQADSGARVRLEGDRLVAEDR